MSTVTGIKRDSKLASGIQTGLDTMFITQNTTGYKILSKATQYSDFVARYAVYTYKTEVKKEDPQEAFDMVLKTYINYETPSNKWLEYLNSTGFVMFSKYPMRILQVLHATLTRSPANLISYLLLEEIMDKDWSDPTNSVGGTLDMFGFPTNAISSATTPYGLSHLGL